MLVEELAIDTTSSDITRFETESHCFKCKSGGEVNICSSCPKVYHHGCADNPRYKLTLETQKEKNKGWTCPCCVLENICPVCNRQVRSYQGQVLKRELSCTICLRSVHSQCYSYHQGIQQIPSQTNIHLMICMECFKLNGIEYIKQKKIFKGQTFYLAKPFYSSYIHQGWLTSSQFAEVVYRMEQFSPPKSFTKFNNKLAVHSNIDKILIVKPDLQYQILSDFKIEFRLDPKSFNKTKLLVKWKQLSLKESTWEDYSVLENLQMLKSKHVQKYYYKKLRNDRRISFYQSLKLTKELDLYSRSEQILKEYISEFLSNKWASHRIAQTNQAINQKSIKKLVILIKHLYYSILPAKSNPNSPFGNTIVFVSQTPELWLNSISKYFSQLNLVYTGQQLQFSLTDQIPLQMVRNGMPIFDMWFIQNQKLLFQSTTELMKFGLIIIQNNKLQQLKIQERYPDSFTLVLHEEGQIITRENEKNVPFYKSIVLEKKIVENKLRQYQQNVDVLVNQTLQHQIPGQNENNQKNIHENPFNTNQIQQNDTNNSNNLTNMNKNNQNHYQQIPQTRTINHSAIELVELSQIQRLHFLRFVLEFGLQFPRFSKLFKKLIRFQASANIFHKDLRTQIAVQHYLQQFLETLLSKTEYSYYFQQWTCVQVSKRIADLAILHKIYQIFREQPWKLPIQEQFIFATQGKITHTSVHWRNQHDIYLIRLILQYGYNNWETICQNFQECQKNEANKIREKGCEYLRNILWPSLQKTLRWKFLINTCIKIRANMLIGNPTFQNLIKKYQNKRR